jgi:putative membrane protein
MKLIFRLLITTVLVLIISKYMDGVSVENITSSIIVAVVLAILNAIVKPILVFFTFPITIFTLGLFLLVINAMIIMICDHFVNGFKVDSFLTALIFSIILSISQSIMFKLTNEDSKK